MQKRKQSAALVWRLAFFIMTIVFFFLVPQGSFGGLIDKENTYWPFRLMSKKALFILSNYRIWFIGQWIAFSGTLLFLELFCCRIEIRKNKAIKIIALIFYLICFLPLIYFSMGSILRLGPFPPMDLGFWLRWFGTNKNLLYIWWVLSGVFLQIGTKL